MIFSVRSCIFGYACVTTQDNFLCGIELANSKEIALTLAQVRFNKVQLPKFQDFEDFSSDCQELVSQVIEIINGERPNDFNLKNAWFLTGTLLQKKIWQEISKIPLGQTITYKDLANKVGHPNAHRAIGTACGANPIAVVIPCHRVIRSPQPENLRRLNRNKSTYHWGNDLKKELLLREGIKF